MSYEVVFRGKLVGDVSKQQAAMNLAKLFKTDPAKVAKLFSGQRVTLKKGLDRETADKYRMVLRKAGLAVSVVSQQPTEQAPPKPPPPPPQPKPAPEPSGHGRAVFAVPGDDDAPQTPSAPAPSAPAPSAPAESAGDSMLAEPGVTIVAQEKVEPPSIDTSSLSLGDDDGPFDPSEKPAPPSFDLSNLSASEIDGNLDEAPRPTAPDIDISDYSASEVDGNLDDRPPPAAPDIDISGLSDAPVDSALDDKPKPEKPNIDTSSMSLD